MKTYRVFHIDSFTRARFSGNPAGVVLDADELTPEQMQAIARELKHSETAFVLSPQGDSHDVQVRFFTPTTEVPMCGHATIAAHYARALALGIDDARVVQRTLAGDIPVEVKRVDDDLVIAMTQKVIEFGFMLPRSTVDAICAALGIRFADLDSMCPVRVVSTGHSKVLVGISDEALLDRMAPDLGSLTELSAALGCNGYYVFTLNHSDRRVSARGRMFAPAIGIAEDPVTGNANGPLGAYLVLHNLVSHDGKKAYLNFEQGRAIGRSGNVSVEVDISDGWPEKVKVSGRAVVVYEAALRI